MKRARVPSTSSFEPSGNCAQLPAELVLVDETGVLGEAEQVIGVSAHYGDCFVVIGPDDEEHSKGHSYQHATQQVEKYDRDGGDDKRDELVPALAEGGAVERGLGQFVSHHDEDGGEAGQGRQAEHPGEQDHRSQEKQAMDDGAEACASSGLDVGSGAHDDGRDRDAADQARHDVANALGA